MTKDETIEALAKELYKQVWQDEDHGPENWPCCVPEATIAYEFMTAQYAELVEVLEFYANEENHICQSVDAGCGCCRETMPSNIDDDEGVLAQLALNNLPKGG